MTVNNQISVTIDIGNFMCVLGNFKVVERLALLCATLLSYSLYKGLHKSVHGSV